MLAAPPSPPCSYQDGGKSAEQLQEYAARKRLRQLLSPLEFFSYLFAAGNLLAGPFFEASDFFDYVQRKVGAFQYGLMLLRRAPVLPNMRGFGRMCCARVTSFRP